MDSLPVEVVQRIGKFLPGKSQPLLAVCSKTLYSYMSHKSLVWWRARKAYIESVEYQEGRTNNVFTTGPIKPGDWWKDFIQGDCPRYCTSPGCRWDPVDYHTIIIWRACIGGPTREPFDRGLFDLAINELDMTLTGKTMEQAGTLLRDRLKEKLQLTEEAGIVAREYWLY